LADEAGITVRSPRDPECRGGTVILDVANGREVTEELIRRQILVDYRPGAGIRIAPHFYTSDDEVRHTIRELASIVERH
jgi:kynureninase